MTAVLATVDDLTFQGLGKACDLRRRSRDNGSLVASDTRLRNREGVVVPQQDDGRGCGVGGPGCIPRRVAQREEIAVGDGDRTPERGGNQSLAGVDHDYVTLQPSRQLQRE